MKIQEITQPNRTWLNLIGSGSLSIGNTFLVISQIYDQIKDNKDSNLIKQWNDDYINFLKLAEEALNFLDSFPDQRDNFVNNMRGTIRSYRDKVIEFDNQLKSK